MAVSAQRTYPQLSAEQLRWFEKLSELVDEHPDTFELEFVDLFDGQTILNLRVKCDNPAERDAFREYAHFIMKKG